MFFSKSFFELWLLYYWWGWEGIMVYSEGGLFPDLGTNYKATPPFDNDTKGKIK